jgi:DNA primase
MDFAKQLKDQIDIARVVADYVRLRRFGNRYSGLCPFHNEKTPSFSVYAEHRFFKCFGCDAKGDVFEFVMKIEGVTFWEALKKLAEQSGIPLPKQSAAGDEKTKLRAVIYEMHEIAAEHFWANLTSPEGTSVRGYLKQRGVTQQAAQNFRLGLSDGSGRTLLRILEQRGYKPEQMEASGLIGKSEDGRLYDRFRNRLMFPIQGETGKIIAFGGRALDPDERAKYLNSPETEIYKKSHVLYNLNRAKQPAMQLDRIVLVEGYMDVIGATQAGVAESVATCGTALTVEQIRAMKRHSQNIHLNFDPDAAGEKAAERSIKMLLEEGMRVKVVQLEGGLDPDEFCKEHGPELYRDRVSGAKTYFYWLADRARAKFNMRDPQGRNDVFQFLLPAIQALNDKLERVSVANDLASYLGVDSGYVLEHFRKSAADRAERGPAAPPPDPSRATDRILLPLLVAEPEARDRLMDDIRTLRSLREGAAANIYASLVQLYEAGENADFNALHERLSPPDQNLLGAIVLEAATTPSLDDGLACVEALRRDETEAARRDLKAQIRLAEREGRIQDVFELMRLLAEV